MKNQLFILCALLGCYLFVGGCNTKTETPEKEYYLFLKYKFNPTQARLDNFGNPVGIPSGHAAQNPSFNRIAAHYYELCPNATTPLGAGNILYKAPETTVGGSNAIDFSLSYPVRENELALAIPLKDITPGTYEYLRVSLSYQNFDVKFKFGSTELEGTLASFIGYNTFIGTYMIKTEPVTVNANKLQGYWGFEAAGQVFTGQAPGTTVPNPLFATSPIPAGSCVVTAAFSEPIVISHDSKKDITIEASLSTNGSFEWEDNGDGKWDPMNGEKVVDMGIRGLIPTVY